MEINKEQFSKNVEKEKPTRQNEQVLDDSFPKAERLLKEMFNEAQDMLDHIKSFGPDVALFPDVSALLGRDMLNAIRLQKVTDFKIPPAMRFDPHFIKKEFGKDVLAREAQEKLKQTIEYKNLYKKIKSILKLKEKQGQDNSKVKISLFDVLAGEGVTIYTTVNILNLIAEDLDVNILFSIQRIGCGESLPYQRHGEYTLSNIIGLRYPIREHYHVEPEGDEKVSWRDAKIGKHGVMPPYPPHLQEKFKDEIARYKKLIKTFGMDFKKCYRPSMTRKNEEVHYMYNKDNGLLYNENDEYSPWRCANWLDLNGLYHRENKFVVVDIEPDMEKEK